MSGSDDGRSVEKSEKQFRAEARRIYGRGPPVKISRIRDKKLRSRLKAQEAKNQTLSLRAKESEIFAQYEPGVLEPENELERTYRIKQKEIEQNSSLITAQLGKFQLTLSELGPYKAKYSRNGRHLLLAGRRGHVSAIDWRQGKLGCELFLNETVRDTTWLHNELFFAVSQKKYVHIYDRAGVEIHKLQKLIEVSYMEFLPYHFLLASIGNSGYLKYLDTSTGALIYEQPTKLGSPTAFAQNPSNAIIHLGSQNGQVSLWSPNLSQPLVKILAHRGPVRSVAIDRTGHYMVSTGQDMTMSVWDIRMFNRINRYKLRRPANSVAISELNLTAVGWGSQATVWRGLFDSATAQVEEEGPHRSRVESPYLNWRGKIEQIENIVWCPYEDLLGVGHHNGFATVLVPGAGEPNFDAYESNPFETKKQRQEAEVRALLEKIQPGMIALDPHFVGKVDPYSSSESNQQELVNGSVKTRKFGQSQPVAPGKPQTQITRRPTGLNALLMEDEAPRKTRNPTIKVSDPDKISRKSNKERRRAKRKRNSNIIE